MSRVSAAAGASPASHPLCEHCANDVVSVLVSELDEAKADHAALQSYLGSLKSGKGGADRKSDAAATLKRTQKEEKALIDKLRKLETQRAALAREEALLVREETELAALETDYWDYYNAFHRSVLEYEAERDSTRAKIESATAGLNILKRTNVLNDAFHIYHDGHFGTINGLRLGRLAAQPVEWAEINAAWGQTALLLATLAKRLSGFQFSQYSLSVRGSFSKILVGKSAFELYGTNEISFGRLFQNSRFDQGMVHFLGALAELAAHIVVASGKSFSLAHPISKDTIGGHSIKVGNDETWTKALKYLLIDLKQCLAHVVIHGS